MYHVEFTPTAAEDLARLNKPIAQRILTKIRWLAENFPALTPKPLTGQWSGVYKRQREKPAHQTRRVDIAGKHNVH
jgi:mRNA interferase RelE/StbE